MIALIHKPVLLNEVLAALPAERCTRILDVTAGGGGHFFALVEKAGAGARGECWDQDPAAAERIAARAQQCDMKERIRFVAKNFREAPGESESAYDFILADLGLSSFQLDDPKRGISLFSNEAVDFRMNPQQGENFGEWIKKRSVAELAEIFEYYGEEPRAKKLALGFKEWPPDLWQSSARLAEKIAALLNYSSPSRIHPATRAFQALRIAINDELGALKSLLAWAPAALAPGGRLAIISFHSLEDRLVKKAFLALASRSPFVILTKKPLLPTEAETAANPRARSAKLRVLAKS